jgi:hypothetical protein
MMGQTLRISSSTPALTTPPPSPPPASLLPGGRCACTIITFQIFENHDSSDLSTFLVNAQVISNIFLVSFLLEEFAHKQNLPKVLLLRVDQASLD